MGENHDHTKTAIDRMVATLEFLRNNWPNAWTAEQLQRSSAGYDATTKAIVELKSWSILRDNEYDD